MIYLDVNDHPSCLSPSPPPTRPEDIKNSIFLNKATIN